LDHVKAAQQANRPVVFVFVHTAVHTQPALQIAAQITGPVVRFTPLKPGDAQTQTSESVVKLRRVHAHLANGGAVAIEGDGYSGQRNRPVTFMGKPFALPFGFAHLAAHHCAALVPLTTQLAPTGHVHFTYYPAFETTATSIRGGGIELFDQFLDFFQAQWPETVPQMKNEVLRFFLPSRT
jgi:lauroyl/myristoyl acyltransferase